MRTVKFVALSLLATVLGAGCTASVDASPEESLMNMEDDSLPNTDDISTYRQLVVKAQEGARAYRTGMMALETATVDDCQRVQDTYDAEVRPAVSQLVQMSKRMDRYMGYYGGDDVADHACVSAAMASELDRHRTAACTSADLGANQDEAGRHVEVMLAYGQHMWDRCDQMMRGSDSGDWGWGPMMDGCSDAAGQCIGMRDADCHGGMMGEMHGRACCDG